MTPEYRRDIVITVATTDQLFNAPAINPFSENDVELLGESGLSVIVRQLQAHRRDWKHTRLLVRLPPDEITPGFESRLVEAIQRYCRAKIADNLLENHLTRIRSSVGLGIVAAVVVAIIAITYVLFTTLLSGVAQVVQVVIAATISLFSWVTLWDPLEALVFNPIPAIRENFVLRKIIELDIVVEPGIVVEPDTRRAGARGLRSAAGEGARSSES